jgi:hypothetical protein
LLCAREQGAFFCQPCLQNLIDSSVVVRWTSAAAESGWVEYGLTSGYGSAVADSGPAVDHELTHPGSKATRPTTTASSRVRTPAPTPSSPAESPPGGRARVRFALAGPARVRAAVFDAAGRTLEFADRDFAAGKHALEWDGFAPGVYTALVSIGPRREALRLVVLR